MVPLDGSMTLWYISHSSQFGMNCKPAEGTFYPITQISNEDVKQGWTRYQPLGYTASHRPTTRLRTTDDHSRGTAIQSVFSPPHHLLIQPMHQRVLSAGLIGDSGKDLTEVQVDNTVEL